MSRSPTRRTWLIGTSAAALGLIGGLAWSHRPLDDDHPGTLAAAVEALLPDGVDAAGAARRASAAFAAGDPRIAAELDLALMFLEHASLVRFSRLDLDARRARLAQWEGSDLGLHRQIFQSLRQIAGFFHYSHPESWPAIGYDGPWVP